MRLKNMKYLMCLMIIIISFLNICYVFLKMKSDITRKYSPNTRLVSSKHRQFQNTFSSFSTDHALSEPDTESQPDAAVGISYPVIITEESNKEPTSVSGSQVRPFRCNSCFRHDFMYLIQNKDICGETNNDSVDLLILILTSHNNVYRRNGIRATWASISRNNTGHVRYVFLLGEVLRDQLMEHVKLEAMRHKDMLMEDFRDSYTNLTYKTIMGLKWASLFCDSAKYVLKTDDDMWINVPEMIRLVKRHEIFLQSGVIGSCGHGQVIRDKRSKGFISFNDFPEPYFPDYCSGSGYVTSMAVAKQVYDISRHVPFLKFEDAYFGLCIDALGTVNLRYQRGFFYTRDYRKDLCILKSKYVFTCHDVPLPLIKKVMQAEC
ncbi:beta-1,3-galactosyltransferase 5-like [Haliotis cracherodii]|uniref:beta-1,3-galactosyltransferase 5-like n=1 Tax=Haliotis cracherodii TaxID=6455 RepID=UPI0039EBF5D0